MAILKKLKGSTLMETLVATVLIVVVFMMSSMILNNLFSSALTSRTHSIEAHLSELHYLYLNDELEMPHVEEFDNWQITAEVFKQNKHAYISFEAVNKLSNKEYNKSFYAKN